MTQVPCGEVTGFTGKCTNEPQVGGAWPCITAPPHCAEPTGFTGQCTHQPWPNPTRYIGCTIYHCPTHDLTHIPHICNIVATGLPGCGGVNPPDKGGDPAAQRAGASEESADNKEAAAPVTSFLGCGYTKTWGLCETRLLGCGQTKDCPTTMPGCGQTNDCPTTMPGCGWSKNPICTDLPGGVDHVVDDDGQADRCLGRPPSKSSYSPFGASRLACIGDRFTLALCGEFVSQLAGYDWAVASDGPSEFDGWHWRPSSEFRIDFSQRAQPAVAA